MTDEEFVRARCPESRCVRHPRFWKPWRIKLSHSPRVYLCRGCKTEAQAWQAARQKLLAVRFGDTFTNPDFTIRVINVFALTGRVGLERDGQTWSESIKVVQMWKRHAMGWVT